MGGNCRRERASLSGAILVCTKEEVGSTERSTTDRCHLRRSNLPVLFLPLIRCNSCVVEERSRIDGAIHYRSMPSPPGGHKFSPSVQDHEGEKRAAAKPAIWTTCRARPRLRWGDSKPSRLTVASTKSCFPKGQPRSILRADGYPTIDTNIV
jgi:hypothetical protein